MMISVNSLPIRATRLETLAPLSSIASVIAAVALALTAFSFGLTAMQDAQRDSQLRTVVTPGTLHAADAASYAPGSGARIAPQRITTS